MEGNSGSYGGLGPQKRVILDIYSPVLIFHIIILIYDKVKIPFCILDAEAIVQGRSAILGPATSLDSDNFLEI